jgi:tetratricopeptide (TPR) repeat protein
MKKIIIIMIILSGASGCSEDFLTLYPETTLNEGNFYQTEQEYILLANGCYVPMRNYEKDIHWVLAELISDNTSFQYNINTGEAVRGVIDQFIITADNRGYSTFWNESYNGVFRCNKLLAEIERPEVTWSNQSYKFRSMGEALFLRALYYFNLVRQFGGVPLVLAPVTAKEAVDIARSTEEQVYASIIQDLQDAAVHFSNADDVRENGRANQEASMALLGKVYLTLHRYQEAVDVLKPIVDSGKFHLLAEYGDLFDPTNKDYEETIFAIQYSESNRELSNRFIFMFAPWSSKGEITNRPNVNMISAGWNQPTQDLINAFEPGDKRLGVSIKFWNGPDWDGQIKDIPYCGKYNPPVSAPDDRAGDNVPIIRYSDVLLMYGEALNELERTGEAIPFVEQVRFRAGLTEPLSGYGKTALQELIAKERQVEFCFENQRWYDLKRTGNALEVMGEHGIREKERKSFLFDISFNVTPHKLLAPIPAEQILINRLEQNPGY